MGAFENHQVLKAEKANFAHVSRCTVDEKLLMKAVF